jgi:hypothetical protein
MAVKGTQVAMMQGRGNTTQVYPALAAFFDANLIKVFEGVFAFESRAHGFAEG